MHLLLFYIRKRNQTTTDCFLYLFRKVLFYIRKRNQTTTKVQQDNGVFHYFTSEKEIKPQLVVFFDAYNLNYFTSEKEIKPQPVLRL